MKRLQATNERNLIRLINSWRYAREIAKVEMADISERLVDCEDELGYIDERIKEAVDRLKWVRERKRRKWKNLT